MMNAVYIVLLCAALVLGEPVVEGPLGTIRGITQTVLDVGVESFLGIPYAKPPTGSLRFARPQAFGPVGDFDALEYGFSCPQPIVFPLQEFSNTTDSEDCLFLNVFRKPGTQSSDRKAVVVLIHGGGFLWGSSGHVEYNMSPLAGVEDLITVSFNYRLGFLGFGYVKGSDFKNLGLFDQRLALEWVQENIEAFGGDAGRVTLIGVSAGSVSVSAHIVTPLNKNKRLFHAALMDAGVITNVLSDPAIVETRSKCLARTVGCDEDDRLIECLRGVPAQELLEKTASAPCAERPMLFYPTADGVFIPENADDYLRNHAGDFLKVRTLIGYGRNEGSMFAVITGQRYTENMTDEDFVKACAGVAVALGAQIDVQNDKVLQRNIVEKYLRRYVDPFTAAANFIADGFFVCPSNAFIKRYSRVNEQVYVYRFERLFEGNYYSFNPAIFGAYHISPFIHFTGSYFGAPHDDHKVVDADKEYILETMKVLSSFARSDEPLLLQGVQWPAYSRNQKILVIDNEPAVKTSLPHNRQCQSVFPQFEKSTTPAKTEL